MVEEQVESKQAMCKSREGITEAKDQGFIKAHLSLQWKYKEEEEMGEVECN